MYYPQQQQQGYEFYPPADPRTQSFPGGVFPGGGFGNINRRLDQLDRRVERLDNQVDRINRRLDRIERRLGIRDEYAQY
ncbi:hypothetical protein ACE38V_12565 [Cytobacillus sp. Hz8]|uniref:hypothetical protein n=1 Tax=Cytobacillus sp. Hz8 TaxID=3347168 RepID=UPI0035E133F4